MLTKMLDTKVTRQLLAVILLIHTLQLVLSQSPSTLDRTSPSTLDQTSQSLSDALNQSLIKPSSNIDQEQLENLRRALDMLLQNQSLFGGNMQQQYPPLPGQSDGQNNWGPGHFHRGPPPPHQHWRHGPPPPPHHRHRGPGGQYESNAQGGPGGYGSYSGY